MSCSLNTALYCLPFAGLILNALDSKDTQEDFRKVIKKLKTTERTRFTRQRRELASILKAGKIHAISAMVSSTTTMATAIAIANPVLSGVAACACTGLLLGHASNFYSNTLELRKVLPPQNIKKRSNEVPKSPSLENFNTGIKTCC